MEKSCPELLQDLKTIEVLRVAARPIAQKQTTTASPPPLLKSENIVVDRIFF